MDSTDREILFRIQSNFPLCSRPFRELSAQLGMAEQDLLARLRRLAQDGVIRRIGPMIDTARMGLASTLAAVGAPEDRIEDVARVISSYPTVSHNYLRLPKGTVAPFSIWFTLSAPSKQQLQRLIADISDKVGLPVRLFASKRTFHVGVRYEEQNHA